MAHRRRGGINRIGSLPRQRRLRRLSRKIGAARQAGNSDRVSRLRERRRAVKNRPSPVTPTPPGFPSQRPPKPELPIEPGRLSLSRFGRRQTAGRRQAMATQRGKLGNLLRNLRGRSR